MNRIPFSSLLTNPDFSLFAPYGALIALAACALEKDPKAAFEQINLTTALEEKYFDEELIDELESGLAAPPDYAQREELHTWLLWLERLSLVKEMIALIEKEQNKTSLLNALSSLLKKQESLLRERQDLWLYRQLAQKTNESLKKPIFPWSTIQEAATIPPLDALDEETALPILDLWFLGELDEQAQKALLQHLQKKLPQDTLFALYREMLADQIKSVWLPLFDDETIALHEKAHQVAQKEGYPMPEKEPLARWLLPHLGHDACITLFAKGKNVLFHQSDGQKHTLSLRQTFSWDDPLLGKLETTVQPIPYDVTEALITTKQALEKIAASPPSPQSLTTLLEAAKVLEHPQLLRVAEQVKQCAFEEKEAPEDALDLLSLALLTRLALERAAAHNPKDIVDIFLANLDHLYDAKQLDQAFLALDTEGIAEYAEGIDLLPSTWWSLPLEAAAMPNDADLHEILDLLPLPATPTPAKTEKAATPVQSTLLQRAREKIAQFPEELRRRLAEFVSLPALSPAVGTGDQQNDEKLYFAWGVEGQDGWEISTTFPKGKTTEKDIVVSIELPKNIKRIIFLGVEKEIPESLLQKRRLLSFLLETLHESQKEMLTQVLLEAEDGTIYVATQLTEE